MSKSKNRSVPSTLCLCSPRPRTNKKSGALSEIAINEEMKDKEGLEVIDTRPQAWPETAAGYKKRGLVPVC